MASYRKKPVIIEATQWWMNGDHPKDDSWRPFEDTGKLPTERREGMVVRYFRHTDITGKTVCSKCGKTMHEHGWIDTLEDGHSWIDTLEDGHNVCPGDWIITGVKGEFYPIKNDIFLETYEKVT